MKSYKLLLAFTLFLAFAFNMKAQYVHERSDQYTPPEDSLVIQKLHHWQDQKFGMLIHWGLYSVAGIVESWSICSDISFVFLLDRRRLNVKALRISSAMSAKKRSD